MSAILSVDDLNDFISPGVACIKPIETLPAEAANSNGAATGETEWRNRFSWVADTNVARDLGLVLAADEALGTTAADVAPPSRPVLASSCPGWVCYAEKTHPHVLPHLSRVKSPQALMGTLLKTTLSRKLGIPPSRIWHLAVMPCFDKKLEASREELTDQAWGGAGSLGKGIRDVDCVITSKEVLMLCESRGINFFQLPRNAASIPPPEPFPDSRLHDFLFARQPPRAPHRAAGSSGGLLHHILQTRASQTPGSDIQIVRGRNADVVEYTVSLEGQPIFRAARYYGFRNIQNLVRRLKPARPSRMPGGKPFGSARRPAGKSAASLEYGYVEVMACPGGCTNGGGQIKADDPIVVERKNLGGQPGLQEQKDWLAEVDEAYFSGSEVDGDGAPSGREGIDGNFPSYIHDTLAYWSAMTGISLDRLAFTSYREVVSDVGKDRATDAEKVVQLAGKVGGGW
ncbi:Cytosolic Fe-S cluster assembly factor nar-1 [Hirsutella minnesotensis 3608]|uniref:Nuclear architecture-related protein 1 n=1 Tax=Hirsutella minnesotensis 3608 TaxID=1043627 RepID=A0A0F8A232_9HYPO|nr:Cytosolic Fe-S cluster assembly factor nar-1 [Hirsutella minnesotensis 3608]